MRWKSRIFTDMIDFKSKLDPRQINKCMLIFNTWQRNVSIYWCQSTGAAGLREINTTQDY
jgi:hypothetical protein